MHQKRRAIDHGILRCAGLDGLGEGSLLAVQQQLQQLLLLSQHRRREGLGSNLFAALVMQRSRFADLPVPDAHSDVRRAGVVQCLDMRLLQFVTG